MNCFKPILFKLDHLSRAVLELLGCRLHWFGETRMSDRIYFGALDSSPALHLELEDGVLKIGMGSDTDRYLWTLDLMESFCGLIESVNSNADVRVLIIHGNGLDFCRGLKAEDFSSATDLRETRVRKTLDRFERCCHRDLALLPQAVIAQVQGGCRFVGIQLLEGCDIVFTDHESEFVIEEKDVHLISSFAKPSTENSFRILENRRATYGSIMGKIFDGKEAVDYGLATQSFYTQELSHEVLSLAKTLCAKDSLALQFTKETLAHVNSMSWDAAVNFTAAKFAQLKSLQSADSSIRATAIASFLAGKSKPGKGV